MSLVFVDNLDIQMQKQNVERDAFDTISAMKAYPATSLPPIFHALCKEDGNMYIYNVDNTVNPDTGKWRILSGGGTGSGISLWTPDSEYVIGNLVLNDNRIYRCKTAHTSSTSFSSDVANWDNLSDDLISKDSDNVISRKSDGLYVASQPDATNSIKGLAQADGKSISSNKGVFSVEVSSNSDNTLSVASDGLYVPTATNAIKGSVKVDNSTIGVNQGTINVNISKKSIKNADFSTEIINETYNYTNNNSESLSYRVTYVSENTTISVDSTVVKVLSSGKFDGTLKAGQTINISTSGAAIFRILTNNVENIITSESDGLMLDRYKNIATTLTPGFVIPDNDTITIDNNGSITSTIGVGSISTRPHNLIKIIKTYESSSKLPTNGMDSVIYRVRNGSGYDDYHWNGSSYEYVKTTSGTNEDGIYINEDETVPIATTEEEGKVRLDGNTIIRVNPSDEHDGTIEVNTEVIATQDDIMDVNNIIDAVDVSTPQLVEYEEDELYDIAWRLVSFDEKPEYTTEDLDAILDKVFEGYGGGSGSSGTTTRSEMTSDSLTNIWNSVFSD